MKSNKLADTNKLNHTKTKIAAVSNGVGEECGWNQTFLNNGQHVVTLEDNPLTSRSLDDVSVLLPLITNPYPIEVDGR